MNPVNVFTNDYSACKYSIGDARQHLFLVLWQKCNIFDSILYDSLYKFVHSRNSSMVLSQENLLYLIFVFLVTLNAIETARCHFYGC